MRTLRLNKETLVELSTAELTGLYGGGLATVPTLRCGPTLSFTCWSEIDACLTAQNCTI